MNEENFQDLLNKIVLKPNEIDGIIVFDPELALSIYHNTKYDKQRHGDDLVNNYNAISGSLSGVHQIADTLKQFGENAQRGELKYGIFQLSHGILILYFLEIHNKPIVVAFISGTDKGLGLMLNHSNGNIEMIEQALSELLV